MQPELLPQRYILAFLCVVLLAGCEAVTSTGVVGQDPFELEPAHWNGTWMTADGEIVMLQVTDDDQGLARIFWVEKEDGKPTLRESQIIVREANDWRLVNSPLAEDDRSDAQQLEFVFARIARNGDELFVWTPRVDAFKAAVDDEALVGGMTANGLLLQRPSEAQLEFITGEAGLKLFDLERPVTLRRVRDKP